MYHCSEENDVNTALCGNAMPEDVVVPFDEVHDPDSRWFNCADCGETLAGLSGGSMVRRSPPEDS
jgi:hypothetical protein